MIQFLRLIFLFFALINGLYSFAQARIIKFENPKVTVFLPPKNTGNGRAIVACPGGGYSYLAKNHEGFYWSPFFNNLGYVYAVVEYNFPNGDPIVPVKEVEDAFRILTDSASVWQISPTNIGIMGFSAGGHLASAIATHPSETMNPAFQILFYPVISLDEKVTHAGTRKGFLGENPSEELVEEWSSDKKVTDKTSPVFLALSSDDKGVSPINSILYYNALVENDVPVAMFIYPEGGHGWGYNTNFKYRDQMLQELTVWLKNLKI